MELIHACGTAGGFTWMIPVKYTKLTSPFGWRTHPISKTRKHHNGIDLAAPRNTPIYATRAGVITIRAFDSSCGNYIKLRHPRDPNNANSHEYCSVYFHMNKFEEGLAVGDTVQQGQLIGYVGTTGSSTGNHLHFGISDSDIAPHKDSRYWVDPELYIFGTEGVVEGPSQIIDSFEKQLPKYDKWNPPSLPLNNGEGFTSNLWHRRAHLLKDSALTIFDGRRLDKRICGGYSNIGLCEGNDTLGEPVFDKQINCPATTEVEWLSKTTSNLNVNPYSPIINNSVLPSNNGYCWGRVKKLYTNCNICNDLKLCKNINTDWFEYNKSGNFYEYGSIPRRGSVMCWSYIGDQKNTEKSCVAFVEDVKGTEIVTVSMMQHSVTGYNTTDVSTNFIYSDLTNYKNNWDLDTNLYKFQGFIYTLPQNYYSTYGKCIEINSHSDSNPHSTISIALKDCKHYNKLRVVYDVKVSVTHTVGSNIDFEDLMQYCNLYITFAQQIVNCRPTESTYLWDKTILPSLVNGTFVGYPFPKGVSLLKRDTLKEVVTLKNLDDGNGTYIKQFDETFSLNTYKNETKQLRLFNGDSDSVQYFQRQLPGYISFTAKSTKKNIGSNDYAIEVSLKIKKIILYK